MSENKNWTARITYYPYPRPEALRSSDMHVETMCGPLRALECQLREQQKNIHSVVMFPPGQSDTEPDRFVDEDTEPVKFPHTLVVAVSRALYLNWLHRELKNTVEYGYVEQFTDLVGWPGPIVVLNGGSHDPSIRKLLAHPSRIPLTTHVTF
jgi:hypothetical protein